MFCFIHLQDSTSGMVRQKHGYTIYIGNTCIDVSAAVLPGHGLGEADDPSLDGAVVGLPDIADDPGN